MTGFVVERVILKERTGCLFFRMLSFPEE